MNCSLIYSYTVIHSFTHCLSVYRRRVSREFYQVIMENGEKINVFLIFSGHTAVNSNRCTGTVWFVNVVPQHNKCIWKQLFVVFFFLFIATVKVNKKPNVHETVSKSFFRRVLFLILLHYLYNCCTV